MKSRQFSAATSVGLSLVNYLYTAKFLPSMKALSEARNEVSNLLWMLLGDDYQGDDNH